MVLQTDDVRDSCRTIARQMRDYTRNLSLNFIVHRSGQRIEALNLAEQELVGHPAGKAAIRLIRKQKKNEKSSLLGLVAWQENLFMGIASRQSAIALTTMNADEFESIRDIRIQAWHMAWHAIHLHNQNHDSEIENTFHNGIVLSGNDQMPVLSGNFKADIFSAVMCGLSGDKDAIRRLAHSRCMGSLTRHAGHNPEDYPFPLAMESTQIAFTDLLHKPPTRNRHIHTALRLSEQIALTYDTNTLNQWHSFSKAAQNMAWHGDEKDIILGAAVSVSQDTFIRATGFLVSEIVQTPPSSILNLEDRYTAFSEDRYNKRLHESMVDRAFEVAANAGMQGNDAMPFIEAANEQNQKLGDGQVLGWCAAALQAAGKAFDLAMKSGSRAPLEDARRQFESTRHATTWESLKQLSEHIIERYRTGYAVTFSDIIDFCGATPALAGIGNSVSLTVRDPAWLKKLNISNDSKPRMAAAYQPAATKNIAPASRAMSAAPSPGGGGGAVAPPPQSYTRKQQEQK